MRAVEITQFGPPEVLKVVERPDPVPAAGEILIDVAAAGVNRPDVIQRLGKYPPPPGASDIPGLEVAGVVAALGAGVARLVDRRSDLRAGGRRRLRRTRGRAARAVPADSGGPDGDPGRGHSRNVLHGLDQRVPARQAEGRRDDPDPRRHERHRHHGDPAGEGLWRARVRDGRQRREVRGDADARRRARVQLPDRGLGR